MLSFKYFHCKALPGSFKERLIMRARRIINHWLKPHIELESADEAAVNYTTEQGKGPRPNSDIRYTTECKSGLEWRIHRRAGQNLIWKTKLIEPKCLSPNACSQYYKEFRKTSIRKWSGEHWLAAFFFLVAHHCCCSLFGCYTRSDLRRL